MTAELSLCGTYAVSIPPGPDGSYTIALCSLAERRYQMVVRASNDGLYHGAPFHVDADTGLVSRNIALLRLSTVISDINACAAAVAGSGCDFSYVLSNAQRGVTVDVWSTVTTSSATGAPSGTPWGSTIFSVGADQARTPIRVTLQAGESRNIEQALAIPGSVRSGSTAAVSIDMSAPGNPALGQNYAFAFFHTVAADAGTETATASVATGAEGIALLHKREDLKVEEARSARGLVAASSARAARTQMQGVVVDAETLAPITGGPLVSLMYCMQPTDEPCSL